MIWEISMWQTKQNKLPCFIDRWCGGGGGGATRTMEVACYSKCQCNCFTCTINQQLALTTKASLLCWE
jgi:hypothetical protein